MNVRCGKMGLALFLLSACNTSENKIPSTQQQPASIHAAPVRKADLSDSSNTLSGHIQTLELRYIVWGCACAPWIEEEYLLKHGNEGLKEHVIFIEPARPELAVPAYFNASRHKIKLKGQFYVKPDYPKATPEMEEPLDRAPVFRYTSIEVSRLPFEFDPREVVSLTLNYSAIACTCPQWRNAHSGADTERYYLEPFSKNLIRADTLFNGKGLPLMIQVRGQVVSYAGFPTGFRADKGAEPGPVFLYSGLKVLQNGPGARD